MGNFDLLRVLKFLPGIILGLTVHEFCHALVAHLCGDSTSKDQGRITLNPLKHIDPIGFLLLIVAGFGWAKPVQFREENLRNPKSDVVKIALAGPLSNALIAMILSGIFAIILKSSPSFFYSKSGEFIYEIIRYAIFINWGLFIFNLIPLPPLDGSHVLLQQLKNRPELHDALYKYGSWLLFGLIIISMASKIDLLPIGPAIEYLSNGFLSLIGVNI